MRLLLATLLMTVLLATTSYGGEVATETPTETSASTLETDIASLQKEWAVIKYKETDKKKQLEMIDALIAKAEEFDKKHEGKAEPLVWHGIIVSTKAGIKGGIGALGLCKEAKKILEKAIEIDGTVLSGAGYTSLGSLYYQVPGWPVGFGDDKKAEELLKKGLQYGPNDIDANFFYGDFLLSEKKYKEAISAFEKALLTPPRFNRPVADDGRRKEINDSIAKAKEKL